MIWECEGEGKKVTTNYVVNDVNVEMWGEGCLSEGYAVNISGYWI